MITSKLNRRAQISMFAAFVLTVLAVGVCMLQGLVGASKISAQSYSSDDIQVMAAFKGWVETYKTDRSSSNIATGERLASAREAIVRRLMEQDPKGLIENAVSGEEYSSLPPEVSKYMEEPVSFYGDFEVIVSDLVDAKTGQMSGSRYDRFVVVEGQRFPAIIYGRRESMTTKYNIPLHGVKIGDLIVLDESPVKRLDSVSMSWRTGHDVEPKITVEIGGKTQFFESEMEIQDFISQQIAVERTIYPDQQQSSWTEGTKRVLMMRVDFSDLPGVPADSTELTEDRSRSTFSQEVGPFYSNNSYGKVLVQFGAMTPVLRMPLPLSFYGAGTNYPQLLSDARTIARAAGYETDNYELDVVALNRANYFAGVAGRGVLGGKGMFLFGYFNSSLIAHELGHNFGAQHANFWNTPDGSVVGAGQSVEQGDYIDIMGSCFYAECHLNAKRKRDFDWLTGADVQTVISDGVFRLNPHDLTSSSGIRALKIRKDDTRDYWIEYRRALGSAAPYLLDGVTIRWGRPNGVTDQLVLTPSTGSPALRVGQSFLDQESRIGFTVEGLGGTVPESVNVGVKFNAACQSLLEQNLTNIMAPSAGGLVSQRVYNFGNCITNVPVTSTEAWINVQPSRNGEVRLVIQPNYSSSPRVGHITVLSSQLTVTQAGSTTGCVSPPSGIVAWWRADGDARDQVGTSHGTLDPHMEYGAGKIGSAFVNGPNPDGARVLIPDSEALAIGPSFTIEGWLKVDGGSGDVITRGPLTLPSGVAYNPAYQITLGQNSSGQRMMWLRLAGLNGSLAYLNFPDYPLGRFFHFAVTLDDSTNRGTFYSNGNIVAQAVTNVRPYTAFDPSVYGVAIGNQPTANFNVPIIGAIDELSIYRRALTQSEIQSIYSAGAAATGAAGKCLEAANAYSLSGRVVGPAGQALRNAQVTLTDPGGVRRTATTSSFGVYNFSDITGSTGYTMSVSSKRYRFSSRLLDITGSVANIDFIGLE